MTKRRRCDLGSFEDDADEARKKRFKAEDAERSKETRELEKEYVKDWDKNTCFACAAHGRLLVCPTCYSPDHPYSQFHEECLDPMDRKSSTCPLCKPCGDNWIERLEDLQELRLEKREERFKAKKPTAQQVREASGGRIDPVEVRTCAFCRVESDKTSAGAFFDLDNVFIGPYVDLRNKKQNFWVHNQCALWAPMVHLDEKSRMFLNVEVEVARARTLACHFCHKRGAAIGCYAKGCTRTFHYPCAVEAGCHVDRSRYLIYCPEHFHSFYLAEQTTKVDQIRISGIKKEVFEMGRYQQPAERKKRLKSMTYRNSFRRYKNSVDVFNNVLADGEFEMGYDLDASINLDPKETRQEAKRTQKFKLVAEPSNLGVTFEDVGGLSEQIRVLKELVLIPLLYPDVFGKYVMRPPKGVLLHGPPGTGKTLLVRALAQSHKQLSFFSRKGPDLLSRYHGDTEKNLEALFQKARDQSPAIIFFDEIDGLCPVRSYKQEQVHNSVVAILLSLMDGLDTNAGTRVFVVGATSQVDKLDPALRRPGRFDREVFVGLPDEKGRHEILRCHTRHWNPIADDDLLKRLAKKTNGMSGADLFGLCTEALLAAIDRVVPDLKKWPFDTWRSEPKAKKISGVVVIPEDFGQILETRSAAKRWEMMFADYDQPPSERRGLGTGRSLNERFELALIDRATREGVLPNMDLDESSDFEDGTT